jgi:hypothetical protein
VVAAVKDFVSQSSAIFGGADIFNIDYLNALDRTAILAAMLTCIVTEDRRPAVSAIVMLAPPETDFDVAQEQVWKNFLSAFELLTGSHMNPQAEDWFKARLRVEVAPDKRWRSALQLISAQPERTAIIIADAGLYGHATLVSDSPGARVPVWWAEAKSAMGVWPIRDHNTRMTVVRDRPASKRAVSSVFLGRSSEPR